MTPRTRVYIVIAVVLGFIGIGATVFFCAASYFEGKRLYSRGYREMVSGRFDAAIASYGAASHKLLDSTTLALAYGNRAWCYANKEMDDEAIRDFTESIRLDPQPIFSVFNRGLAYVRKGEFEKARTDFTTTIGKDRNAAEAYYNRGFIFMLRGDWDLAIADLSEAIRCAPREPQYFMTRGIACGANDQTDAAIADFDSVLRLFPWHASAFIYRAEAYARKGNAAKGLSDVTEAIAAMPLAPQLHFARGHICLDRGLIDEGVENLNEAIRLWPNYDYAYLQLARAAALKEDWPASLGYAEKTLELNPKIAGAHFFRGRALTRQGRYDEAIAAFDRTLRLDSSQLWAIYYRAQNYAYRQEYSRALDELRWMVEQFPRAEVAHLALGWFLATCPNDAYRDGSEAIEEATKGCEISHWQTWYGLDAIGAAYAERGDFERAGKFATMALTLPGLTPKERVRLEDRLARYRVGIAIRDLGGADLTPTLFEEAINAYANHDFDRVIRCLNVVLPPNPGASVSAALFHFFDGTHDRKHRPPWAPGETAEVTNGFYYRGLAYEKRREWTNAIADFSTAIWREPNSRLARAERSVCYERENQPELAFRDLDEILRRDEEDALAYAVRADILERRKQTAAAAEAATKAIRLDRKLPLPHEVRGRIHLAENKLEEADREFGEAERLDPDRVEDILDWVETLKRNRNYKNAKIELRETAERFPRSARAQNALGWFLATCPDRARRDGAEAISHATLACELSKWANPDFVDTLATAYAEAGDFDHAAKYMVDAISKLAPDSEDRADFEKHLVSFKRREAWRED